MEKTKSICIYHNALWAPYKGEIFSALHEQAAQLQDTELQLRFIHAARALQERRNMKLDLGRHRYPYTLLHEGILEEVPLWRRCWAMLRSGWALDADLVVLPGYERLEYWLLLAVCLLRGKRTAVFVDSTYYDRPRRRTTDLLKRFFFSRCQGFLCYGSRSREYLLHYRVPAERIEVDCQAAALPYSYSPAMALRTRRADPARGLQWLFVGRLAPEKNVDLLLQAFAACRREQGPRDHLHIVGGGPLEAPLRQLASDLGLAEAVTFHGMQDHAALLTHYGQAHALVLPSQSEAWGLVVNEALAFGCSVIASDRCGCVPELVREGLSGHVFPSGDSEGLARAMQRLARELRAPGALESRVRACIQLAMEYTPAHAAHHILGRCLAILGEPLPTPPRMSSQAIAATEKHQARAC